MATVVEWMVWRGTKKSPGASPRNRASLPAADNPIHFTSFVLQPDQSIIPGQRPENARPGRWSRPAAAIILTYLIGVVFFPILGFDFVELDVPAVVIFNRSVHGLTGENLKVIFTSRCLTSYYPIRTLTFAVDYQFWGLNPTGFKLTNLLIHLANVLLVFWLVLRILRRSAAGGGSSKGWWDVSVATFSAGVFAVHPVVVEPVTWVAGREELLMTLGALGCIHFHLLARHLSEAGDKPRRAWACYVCAALCCAAACLSNVVGAMIPMIVTAWDVLMLPKPKWRRIFYGTASLWVIGAATIAVKKIGDGLQPVRSAVGPFTAPIRDLGVDLDPRFELTAAFSAERVMLALDVYRMNLKSVFWPNDLAANYTLPAPSGFLAKEVIIGGIALGLTCVILWMLRHRKAALFGVVWFGLALGPASQIVPHHVPRADRFLYLPLIGLVLLLAIGLRPLGNFLKGRAAVAGAIAVGVSCLFLLDALSAYQVQTWRTTVAMWENCLRVNPDNATAHDALGQVLVLRGDLDRAMQHYRRAIELDSDSPEMLHLLSVHYATCHDEELRNYDEGVRLASRACELSNWETPRYVRGLADIYSIRAASLANSGLFDQAIRDFSKAIETDPTHDLPLYNLALLLANCSDESMRKPEQAVRLAEKARGLTEHPGAPHLKLLAEVYAAVGRLDQAIAAADEALKLAEAAGNRELADDIRDRLKRYRDHASNGTTE